jgi:acyl-coenzyme A thioesterase PaaI-like protein
VDPEGAWARFQAHAGLQGYDGIVHGGVIAAVLDAAMTHCLFHRGIKAVTGDLHVRYLESVPCSSKLEVFAKLEAARPPLYRMKAELRCEGRMMARAEARFMQRPSGGGDVERPGP